GLSHNDSTGRDPLTRIRDCGYPGGYWGENVLVGSTTAQGAFDLWKSSPGHYANMTNPVFRVIGIGQHGSYWTADFGSIDDSGQPGPTPTNTPTPIRTNTPTPTATATASPTPTSTATASPTPISTATESPTPTPIPTRAPDSTGRWHAWVPGLAADRN
ncbi:MAG: CAP domain-containing protein, partial [Hyphomicrobiales bacterium]